jgi:hypothetical protein
MVYKDFKEQKLKNCPRRNSDTELIYLANILWGGICQIVKFSLKDGVIVVSKFLITLTMLLLP